MLDFYKNKNVFITGHTGFKGTWLSRVLLKAGANVTGYALKPHSDTSLFEQTKTANDIHSIIEDIRNSDSLKKELLNARPEIVIHMAAQPIVRLSYKEPVKTYEINVMGTVNILEAVRSCPSVKSFINVTTDKVYENKEKPSGYKENENLCGFDPYSSSKSCSELVTYSYRNSFFNYIDAPAISTARSGNVIGGGDYSEDRIIPDCIKAANKGKEIIVRNPDSVRPYQYILDCLYGYFLLAEKQYKNKSLEGAYNFGSEEGSCVKTGELASIFCEVFGQGAKWHAQDNDGPHETNFLKLDSSKSREILGWKPKCDVRAVVKKTVEFAKLKTDVERKKCIDNQISEYLTSYET